MPAVPRKLRRIDAHLPLALVGLLVARPSAGSLAAGAVLVLAGIAVRAWAAGFLDKGGPLCTDGPYRFLRHPLYLGSLIAALGFVVMMNVIWGWAIILPLFLLLYTVQMLGEERHLRAAYGDAHQRYARAVPILLPLPGRRTETQGRRWELARALRNREQWHVVVTLSLVALFILRWRAL
jgi:protein-S-isoprenylcysteine O-methyltransferase Ste14